MPELRAAQGSSGTPPAGGGEEARGDVFDGDEDGRGACPKPATVS